MAKEENTFPLKFHLKLHSMLYIFFCAELNIKHKIISLFFDFLLTLLSQEKNLIPISIGYKYLNIKKLTYNSIIQKMVSYLKIFTYS